MLTENDVIEAVCRYLRRSKCKIVSTATTNQKGHDIVAREQSGAMLYIEAKGQTSSVTTSAGHGMPFSYKQVSSHYARALLRSLQTVSGGRSVGIAAPNIPE